MKPALYDWKYMLRDYTRLLVNDKWSWCRHCRRPVEHVEMPADGQPDQKVPVCLDCGLADPEYLRIITEHHTGTDS